MFNYPTYFTEKKSQPDIISLVSANTWLRDICRCIYPKCSRLVSSCGRLRGLDNIRSGSFNYLGFGSVLDQVDRRKLGFTQLLLVLYQYGGGFL